MIPTATPASGTEPTLDAMYRAVIGPKHTDIYLRYFAKRDAGGGFVSWNWPALFVQFFQWDRTCKLAENHWSQRLYGHILGCIERLAWHLTSLRDEASRASR